MNAIVTLFLLVILIIVNYMIARKFEQIVFAKGYGKELHSFAICFFLGIIGYLYVIALPNAKFDNLSLKQQRKIIEMLSATQSEREE